MSALRPRSVFVNALTVSRVPFIVAFMAFAVAAVLRGGSLALEICAGFCMFIAGITDLFDGMLARRWSVVSTFGKMADPLMDKVFFIVTFPTLLWIIGWRNVKDLHALVMLVFTVLYILRDQWVTFLRSIGSYYKADNGALWLGKVRTALSFPAAGYIYAYLAFGHYLPEAWQNAFLWSCYALEFVLIAINVWSMVYYTKHYSEYLKRAIRPE
jgi:CDP-diacylglycerol--glycerol-3-phosphate 3-phosphatidyltransferase